MDKVSFDWLLSYYRFVKFLCEPDADKACQDLDKKNVSGVEITVKRAEKDRKR